MPYSDGLIDLQEISQSQIQDLFSLARLVKRSSRQQAPKYSGLTAALLFFEASTRTRFSFETACARIGLYPLVLSGVESTSLAKGETFEDTVLNVQAMNPEIFVIRCGNHAALRKIRQKLKRPVINAGWGVQGHPTQALLDAFCWQENCGSLEGKRLLIVGDIKHSRVAASHLELAKTLGYEVAVCGPLEFLPESDQVIKFLKLEDGIGWADALMVLRVQLERHSREFSLDSYQSKYQIGSERLKKLPKDMIIFHPGPVNYGIELDSSVPEDSRCQILSQVEHGVWLRQALLQKVLEEAL